MGGFLFEVEQGYPCEFFWRLEVIERIGFVRGVSVGVCMLLKMWGDAQAFAFA
jgi:hypothetical protein